MGMFDGLLEGLYNRFVEKGLIDEEDNIYKKYPTNDISTQNNNSNNIKNSRGAITQQSIGGREGIAITDKHPHNKRKNDATTAGGKKKKGIPYATKNENTNPQQQQQQQQEQLLCNDRDVDFDSGDGGDIEGLEETNNTASGTSTTQQTFISTQQNTACIDNQFTPHDDCSGDNCTLGKCMARRITTSLHNNCPKGGCIMNTVYGKRIDFCAVIDDCKQQQGGIDIEEKYPLVLRVLNEGAALKLPKKRTQPQQQSTPAAPRRQALEGEYNTNMMKELENIVVMSLNVPTINEVDGNRQILLLCEIELDGRDWQGLSSQEKEIAVVSQFA